MSCSVGGQRVIDLEFLRDLTLTRKTRVFKAAALRLDNLDDPLSMVGLASDDQRSRVEARGLARFFLCDFLGCHIAGSPEKATHDFWNAAQDFINSDVTSPERQGRYQVAIQAYLEEPDEQIAPEAFMHRAIDENDRPRLRQRLRDEGLDPQRAIVKDTAMTTLVLRSFTTRSRSSMAAESEGPLDAPLWDVSELVNPDLDARLQPMLGRVLK